MNVLRALHTARRILTATGVAALAATCLASTGTTSSAQGDHRSEVTSATKEWKRSTSRDVVLATKEWKASASTSRTKEW